MSQRRTKGKYNDGCIKIFQLLKLLYEDKADYDRVIQIFSDEFKPIKDERLNIKKQHVILNKYLNTLKVFGVKVKKINNKFVMLNGPFSLNFTLDDIKSVNILKKLYEVLPKGKTRSSLGDFLKMVETRLDSKSNLYLSNISSTDTTDFSFYYSSIREQIEKCEKFCEEPYKINIKYLEKGKECSAIGEAKQVIYDCKKAYLRITKSGFGHPIDISVSDILSIEQLPNAKGKFETDSTVVFTIKGRLAKAYNLKENEYVRDTLDDGSLVIVSHHEPLDKLISRLIKYDYECKINKPKYVQNRMVEMINDTLKNYEE